MIISTKKVESNEFDLNVKRIISSLHRDSEVECAVKITRDNQKLRRTKQTKHWKRQSFIAVLSLTHFQFFEDCWDIAMYDVSCTSSTSGSPHHPHIRVTNS